MRRAAIILCAFAAACAEPDTTAAPLTPPAANESFESAAEVTVRIDGQVESASKTQYADRAITLLESAQDRERRLVSASDWEALRSDATLTLELAFDDEQTLDTQAQPSITIDGLLVTFGDARRKHQVLVRLGDTYLSAFSRVDATLWDELHAAVAASR